MPVQQEPSDKENIVPKAVKSAPVLMELIPVVEETESDQLAREVSDEMDNKVRQKIFRQQCWTKRKESHPYAGGCQGFPQSESRSTFDEMLEGLSRRNVADEIMEQVAGEEVAQQVWNVVTVLHLLEDHPVMTMVESNLQTRGWSAQLLILSGEASSYWLDLQVPLTAEDGDVLLGSLVSDQGASSDDEIVSRRIESVDQ